MLKSEDRKTPFKRERERQRERRDGVKVTTYYVVGFGAAV